MALRLLGCPQSRFALIGLFNSRNSELHGRFHMGNLMSTVVLSGLYERTCHGLCM